MPEIVFDEWLKEEIEISGWPFEDENPALNEYWSSLFLHKPLARWKESEWTAETRDYDTIDLHDATQRRILNVLAQPGLLYTENSGPFTRFAPKRTASCREYIQSHGRTPGNIVGVLNSAGHLEILAGHHRLAACQSFPEMKIQIPMYHTTIID